MGILFALEKAGCPYSGKAMQRSSYSMISSGAT